MEPDLAMKAEEQKTKRKKSKPRKDPEAKWIRHLNNGFKLFSELGLPMSEFRKATARLVKKGPHICSFGSVKRWRRTEKKKRYTDTEMSTFITEVARKRRISLKASVPRAHRVQAEGRSLSYCLFAQVLHRLQRYRMPVFCQRFTTKHQSAMS